MSLSRCASCGLIFNREFDPQLLEYDASFENSQEFSPSFRAYADELAERLIGDYQLHGKNIVEIGSGKGEFLKRLSVGGQNRCTGYDPSFQDSGEGERAGVRLVEDYYSERYASRPVDFFCCRHVLEHFSAPATLLSRLKKANVGREVAAYFEVPNAEFIFEGLGLWDLIYQHVCYFTLDSLVALFDRTGFEVLRAGTAFSDQFLYIETRLPARQPSEPAKKRRSNGARDTAASAEAFARRHKETTSRWSAFLKDRSDAGQRLAFWGAGSKGASFLNVVPGAREIACVVDPNTRKHGKFLPGTGQMIHPVDYLKQYQPDIVITLNPLYVTEIMSTLSSLGVAARVVIEPA
ncbi:MAG TPA: class I SAM-dependent methyltransferase [Bryobacteraceae bacterium]|nr:class I SAM-dependent methyltransferase [Bryobacteraceae bacterium]